MKEWKLYQEMYRRLITTHGDDRSNFVEQESDEIVEPALQFFRERGQVAVYPAKSYAVAIIYATMLEKVYNEDFYEVLDDPELLGGQDPTFVPYSEDPENYDAIIEGLKSIPDWLKGGWAPFTVNYFYLECTEEGIEKVNESTA